METLVCPTCGCSLVRLGIGKDEAVAHDHEGRDYYFCCDGCLDQFVVDPQRHLRETGDLIVCPVCLTEKAPNLAITLEHGGEHIYFCRCPHCLDEFKKNPAYYIRRLGGEEDHPGTFETACRTE